MSTMITKCGRKQRRHLVIQRALELPGSALRMASAGRVRDQLGAYREGVSSP